MFSDNVTRVTLGRIDVSICSHYGVDSEQDTRFVLDGFVCVCLGVCVQWRFGLQAGSPSSHL